MEGGAWRGRADAHVAVTLDPHPFGHRPAAAVAESDVTASDIGVNLKGPALNSETVVAATLPPEADLVADGIGERQREPRRGRAEPEVAGKPVEQ